MTDLINFLWEGLAFLGIVGLYILLVAAIVMTVVGVVSLIRDGW